MTMAIMSVTLRPLPKCMTYMIYRIKYNTTMNRSISFGYYSKATKLLHYLLIANVMKLFLPLI